MILKGKYRVLWQDIIIQVSLDKIYHMTILRYHMTCISLLIGDSGVQECLRENLVLLN